MGRAAAMALPVYKMKMIFSKKNSLVVGFLALCLAAVCPGYEYDGNDFATEVVSYVKGTGAVLDYISGKPFDDPNRALDRPTVDTTGDNENIPVASIVPVVGVYSAFRSFELVTIGHGGQLILKFNHPVSNDKNNPYGIDFIIFGNAQQNAGQYWLNGNPATFIIGSSSAIEEHAVVSVSQDGNNWYRYNNGPYADSFAPTFGRIYDPNHPDVNIGSWNHWWGRPTNPTLPVDPNLGPSLFLGKSLACMSQVYGQSAGGTGFDLAQSGMEWVQYVRIEGNASCTPEVDSVADVASCGDYKHPYPEGDINEDCRVDYKDLMVLQRYWLAEITDANDPAATADIYEDDIVNLYDFAMAAGSWLQCTWDCQ